VFDFSTKGILDVAKTNRWTLQFWVYPSVTNDNQVEIGSLDDNILIMDKESDGYRISVAGANTNASEVLRANHWSHISITRNGDNWVIYTVVDRDPDDIHIVATDPFTLSTTAEKNFTLGRDLKGNIDDVRFWNRPLTKDEIMSGYSRILEGNESGLRGYYTFDYVLPGYAFDMSYVGTVYNGNHAVLNTLEFDDNVPDDTYQLALKGVADKNGNYQISGIPVIGKGTSYSIVPSLGVHSFNPTEDTRYFNGTALVHNGVNFTDVSSFAVSGKVVYKGGNYPVQGCTFEVDGSIVVSNGQPVTSGYDGSFTISVPIGVHKVQVKKPGHTFEDDGYLLENGKDMNYNRPFSNIVFNNTTRVKLIGRYQ